MEESASENAVKKTVAICSGILLAGAVALFVVYHIVNVLPPEGMSYNIQAAAVFEDAACEKCHRGNSNGFDMQETMAKLKKDTVTDEVALAKIEHATVIKPAMPPKTYYLTHWGAAINSSKKKLLEEWVNHQRSSYYPAPESLTGNVSEMFRNEPVRPVQKPEKTDSKKTELGRKLFFDVRLSADNSVSCNTCHRLETGGTDNRQYSQGAGKTLLKINTPTVFNACFQFRQFWDGRASDLYDQLREHLTDRSTMGNRSLKAIAEKLDEDDDLKDRFLEIYRAGITPATLVETVVEFEKTLVTSGSRFDKYLQGSLQSLNDAEVAGYELFKSNRCATCHVGTVLGGQSIEKQGIYGNYYKDRGWQMNEKDADKFKTPGLRNVALTKPYFHDGSRQTLCDAVESMGKYQSGTKLDDTDTKAIVLFLNTLSK